MASTTQRKQARLNIRASKREKSLIERAARQLNVSVSEFVLQRALTEAEAILADNARFRVTKAQYDAFCAALDEPPRDIPAMRKLLTEPGLFDG